ncbi:tRNA modification GTPase MnmE [Condylostylus longicornis]|uniref:tRNA modification GTPase MnmE n=1 Tax=Condylostylus longicornis TaxID=2530218 RepID=UPI00244DBAF8|nr:tRNA modification GTPase MnmE [Condylostylus longicornis]
MILKSLEILSASLKFPYTICQYSQSTIYSLSSGHGKCGVSVIRVSGPKAKLALTNLIGKKFEPKPRYAYLKSIYHPKNGDKIDNGLILWFPGPRSFTGEDCCEFQVHGSIAVVNCILGALSTIPEFRLAKPGEYTKRSFYNGKLDLVQAEGLADLIHSETESQRKQALLQANGTLSKLYGNWRNNIIRSIAHLEAYIDFAEDENIEDNTILEIYSNVVNLKNSIEEHLNDNRRGEILRNGVRTAIIGRPNVGKSSFMNYLCQRSISIVTSTPGTTRDIIESSVNIGEYPVVFADTAGLRNITEDAIEAEGINRAVNYIKTADFVIIIFDAMDLIRHLNQNKSVNEYLRSYTESLRLPNNVLIDKKIIRIANKIDLLSENEMQKIVHIGGLNFMSCKTNQSIEKVIQQIKICLEEICGNPVPENPYLTKERYRQSLNQCLQNIYSFLESFQIDLNKNQDAIILDENQDLAILAQKLRKAVRNIEEITGHIRIDDILDVIFKDFCIGK